VVQVADDQVVLVIFADAVEALDRMATELGNTWMGANVAPWLDRPPERRMGPVIGSVNVSVTRPRRPTSAARQNGPTDAA
jgi:hypothetical protein